MGISHTEGEYQHVNRSVENGKLQIKFISAPLTLTLKPDLQLAKPLDTKLLLYCRICPAWGLVEHDPFCCALGVRVLSGPPVNTSKSCAGYSPTSQRALPCTLHRNKLQVPALSSGTMNHNLTNLILPIHFQLTCVHTQLWDGAGVRALMNWFPAVFPRCSGVSVGGSGARTIRLRPSLVFQPHHVDIFLNVMEKAMNNISARLS